MNGRWVYRTGIVVTALLMSSPPARAQKKYAAAFPRDSAINLQETEFLTFWEVLHDKAKPSPMYEVALDQLTITLTEGAVKFTKPDGTSRIEQERLGAVRFESKGTVLQDEGLNDVPSREIVVLLKDVQQKNEVVAVISASRT